MIGSRCFGFWWRGVFSALNKIATVVIRFCRSCDSSLVEWCRWEIASYWQSEHKAFFLLPSDTKHTNSPIPWSPSQQELTALNTASSAITQQCHKDFLKKRMMYLSSFLMKRFSWLLSLQPMPGKAPFKDELFPSHFAALHVFFFQNLLNTIHPMA